MTRLALAVTATVVAAVAVMLGVPAHARDVARAEAKRAQAASWALPSTVATPVRDAFADCATASSGQVSCPNANPAARIGAPSRTPTPTPTPSGVPPDVGSLLGRTPCYLDTMPRVQARRHPTGQAADCIAPGNVDVYGFIGSTPADADGAAGESITSDCFGRLALQAGRAVVAVRPVGCADSATTASAVPGIRRAVLPTLRLVRAAIGGTIYASAPGTAKGYRIVR